jgi:hypothetical protein
MAYLPFPTSFYQPFTLYIHLPATVVFRSTVGFISHNHSPCLASTVNIFLMQDASRLVPPYLVDWVSGQALIGKVSCLVRFAFQVQH